MKQARRLPHKNGQRRATGQSQSRQSRSIFWSLAGVLAVEVFGSLAVWLSCSRALANAYMTLSLWIQLHVATAESRPNQAFSSRLETVRILQPCRLRKSRANSACSSIDHFSPTDTLPNPGRPFSALTHLCCNLAPVCHTASISQITVQTSSNRRDLTSSLIKLPSLRFTPTSTKAIVVTCTAHRLQWTLPTC